VRKCLIIPPLLLAVAVAAWPQMRGGGFGGGFGRSGFGRPGFANPGFGNRFGFPGRLGFSGLVFLGDPLIYPDYPPVDQPSPSLIVVQSNPNPAPSVPPSEPLMIVWQGDRYVRYGGGTKADQVHSLGDYADSNSSTRRGPSSAHASSSGELNQPQLPPAVLVFRDGHREQVHDYVIASGKLYLRGDYWRDGYWTRTVELAAVDVPQTLSANQQNGVIFVLPAAPNEVVTRP
jgi:hypothetical protein